MTSKATLIGGLFVLAAVSTAVGFGFGGGGFGGGGGGLGGGGFRGGGGLGGRGGGGFRGGGPPIAIPPAHRPGGGVVRPPDTTIRPAHPGTPGPSRGWHHGDWRHYWRPGWQRGWRAGRWYRHSGYERYRNPYVTDAPAKPTKPEPGSDRAKQEAEKRFEEARKAFEKRGYGTALARINAAIRLVPNDRKAQEFRALCQFAQRRYNQAAADLYDVLADGPGWDWATMIGLYKSRKSYETHLRALEAHCRREKKDAAARLVLAYHYLTAGHSATARRHLTEVVALKPEDEVAKDLLEMTKGKKSGEGEPAPEVEEERETVPDLPDSFDPAGEWTAVPKDGGEIVLVFTKEKKFTWRFVAPGESAEYAGNYVFDRSRLLLEDLDQGAFVARITPAGTDAFVFRPEGEDDDPGIRFTRKKK